MMYGWGLGPAGWMFMGLFWVVLIGLAAWAVTALVPVARPGAAHEPAPSVETALTILDRRFASGELDIEQYRQAKRELRESPRT